MIENKIIAERDFNNLQAIISEHNRNGWVVKQIYVFGIRFTTYYALLEKETKKDE